jgi:hypothetical protein
MSNVQILSNVKRLLLFKQNDLSCVLYTPNITHLSIIQPDKEFTPLQQCEYLQHLIIFKAMYPVNGGILPKNLRTFKLYLGKDAELNNQDYPDMMWSFGPAPSYDFKYFNEWRTTARNPTYIPVPTIEEQKKKGQALDDSDDHNINNDFASGLFSSFIGTTIGSSTIHDDSGHGSGSDSDYNKDIS